MQTTRVDEFSTHEKDGILYSRGHVLPFGATKTHNDGINFSISSRDATAATLVLFHEGEPHPFVEIPFPPEFKVGNNYSMIVYGLNIEDIEYGYRFDGPYDVKKGLLFDYDRILLDPYAKLVSGQDTWREKKYGDTDFVHRGKVILDDYDWEEDLQLNIPIEDLVIYEMHVRNFTAHESSGVKYPGTYEAVIEKIPYLKSLGVNCIELLPIFEFDELEHARTHNGDTLINSWGYSTLDFYAPKAGYAATGFIGMTHDEVKNMVKKLHTNGIEIILDVVFNHTAEGNEYGPCISYKGIDNRFFYMLTPEGYYYNFTGCGNTMNCNAPLVRSHILDCLRYWVADYHIDGFRFDLASILSRDEDGRLISNPPILEELVYDSILGKTKLIAEAWDADGSYQVGSFPNWGKWAEWNGRYRDCVRRFIKSDASAGPELVRRIQGSPDMYGSRGAAASVNFVTCHDGFTLRDLVSYNNKHNVANGEDNRDGCDNNYSWNCGSEGETGDAEILALRNRQIKNAATLLLLSRGVPMLLSGDELGNSQMGNNNAYCQDNDMAYINWDDLDKHRDIFEYFRKLIELRTSHPVLRRTDYSERKNPLGYTELSFHSKTPWMLDINSDFLCFGVMYSESGKDYNLHNDTFIYLACNAFWEEQEFRLPELPYGMKWKIYLYSANATEKAKLTSDNRIKLIGRSSMILISTKKV